MKPLTTYLVRVGELTLKGGNLKDFEQRLVQNAQLFLDGTGSHVRIRAGRMYVRVKPEFEEQAEYALSHLIGAAGWARAQTVEHSIDAITKAVVIEAEKAAARGCKTFKIEARRSDKQFPLTSYEIARITGEAVHQEGILSVNVHTPDVTIMVEVREHCYVYGAQTPGHRGLPCGTGGKGLLLLSGGIDSPVAGFRMLSRGMKIDCVYFHSWPYTSEEAQQKVEDLAKILASYGLGTHLNIVPFTRVQEYIRDRAPHAYATILLRMCMMRVANLACEITGAQAIITGESLGQVASQTIENMSVTNGMASYPVLRPLIGMDKEEIIQKAIEIGSYEISILPYADCCVLFSPKHPVLRANRDEVMHIWEELKIDTLLIEAFNAREHKRFGWHAAVKST